MSRQVANFLFFISIQKTKTIDRFFLPHLVKLRSFVRISRKLSANYKEMCGVRARLLHFLVKIRQVAAPCSISLRQILMKVHSFSKFDMSNRNHDKAVLFGLYEKYEQFQILRDIGYVNHLLFSRALSLSRQNTPEISVQNATDRFGPTGKVSKKRVLRWTTGAIHSTKIPTGPTGKSGPPQKVDEFFRNFSGWTEPIHCVLDRNFR